MALFKKIFNPHAVGGLSLLDDFHEQKEQLERAKRAMQSLVDSNSLAEQKKELDHMKQSLVDSNSLANVADYTGKSLEEAYSLFKEANYANYVTKSLIGANSLDSIANYTVHAGLEAPIRTAPREYPVVPSTNVFDLFERLEKKVNSLEQRMKIMEMGKRGAL